MSVEVRKKKTPANFHYEEQKLAGEVGVREVQLTGL